MAQSKEIFQHIRGAWECAYVYVISMCCTNWFWIYSLFCAHMYICARFLLCLSMCLCFFFLCHRLARRIRGGVESSPGPRMTPSRQRRATTLDSRPANRPSTALPASFKTPDGLAVRGGGVGSMSINLLGKKKHVLFCKLIFPIISDGVEGGAYELNIHSCYAHSKSPRTYCPPCNVFPHNHSTCTTP